jgi:hypothetical protein
MESTLRDQLEISSMDNDTCSTIRSISFYFVLEYGRPDSTPSFGIYIQVPRRALLTDRNTTDTPGQPTQRYSKLLSGLVELFISGTVTDSLSS